MADLSINIAGVVFKNPLIVASGTFGFGREYSELYALNNLGGVATKGTTLHQRNGNPSPRIAEGNAVILNSVGLQNPGIDSFIRNDLPWLKQQDTVIIANIAGSDISEYVEICEKLNDTDVDMIELNISCPNVKCGGAAFGTDAKLAAELTRQAKAHTKKPIMVKLTPNVTNIGDIAAAVESAGADAISLINTLTGMKIDIITKRPVLRNNTGGMSGPALLPLAVKMVWETAKCVKIPIIGMGGISKPEDAIEIMLAGSAAFQVGTANFTDPYAPIRILAGLEKYLDENRIESVSELTGGLKIWE